MENPARPGPDDLHFSAPAGSAFPQGRMYVLLAEPGEKIAEVRLAASAIVESVEVVFESKEGGRRTDAAGASRGSEPIQLPAHGRLLGISGRSGWHVDALALHWEGSRSMPVGGPGGDTTFHLVSCYRDGQYQADVAGLWGYCDDEGLESIGLVFWSAERSRPLDA